MTFQWKGTHLVAKQSENKGKQKHYEQSCPQNGKRVVNRWLGLDSFTEGLIFLKHLGKPCLSDFPALLVGC